MSPSRFGGKRSPTSWTSPPFFSGQDSAGPVEAVEGAGFADDWVLGLPSCSDECACVVHAKWGVAKAEILAMLGEKRVKELVSEVPRPIRPAWMKCPGCGRAVSPRKDRVDAAELGASADRPGPPGLARSGFAA